MLRAPSPRVCGVSPNRWGFVSKTPLPPRGFFFFVGAALAPPPQCCGLFSPLFGPRIFFSHPPAPSFQCGGHPILPQPLSVLTPREGLSPAVSPPTLIPPGGFPHPAKGIPRGSLTQSRAQMGAPKKFERTPMWPLGTNPKPKGVVTF